MGGMVIISPRKIGVTTKWGCCCSTNSVVRRVLSIGRAVIAMSMRRRRRMVVEMVRMARGC